MSAEGGFRMNTTRITHETLEGEVMIIDFELGTYFRLDGVGAVVWNAIGEGSSLGGIVHFVAQRFDGDEAELRACVSALLGELEAEHLIVRCTEGECVSKAANGGSNGNLQRQPFVAPSFEKYTDLQELLLLDPIHEVEEATGWPNRKANT